MMHVDLSLALHYLSPKTLAAIYAEAEAHVDGVDEYAPAICEIVNFHSCMHLVRAKQTAYNAAIDELSGSV